LPVSAGPGWIAANYRRWPNPGREPLATSSERVLQLRTGSPPVSAPAWCGAGVADGRPAVRRAGWLEKIGTDACERRIGEMQG